MFKTSNYQETSENRQLFGLTQHHRGKKKMCEVLKKEKKVRHISLGSLNNTFTMKKAKKEKCQGK